MGKKVTAGTYRLIEESVGSGGRNSRSDVKTIQQLLIAAGFPIAKGAIRKSYTEISAETATE